MNPANFPGGCAPGPLLLFISELSQSVNSTVNTLNFPGGCAPGSLLNGHRVLNLTMTPVIFPGAAPPDPCYFSFQNGHNVGENDFFKSLILTQYAISARDAI